MGIRKFGTGDVLGRDDEDPQGISKSAQQAADGEWTDKDEAELARESQEG